jgi:hypothetical protein
MQAKGRSMSDENGKPIFEVWNKYEDIAMHFNDLLIKLRTQALGGVAAIATIVAVISKNGPDGTFNWAIMSGVFFFLSVFWVAVWVLDFKYYNRLLHGAVDAIKEIEALSKTQTHVKELSLSHKIEDAVAGIKTQPDTALHKTISVGRYSFYLIVFISLIAGLVFSLWKQFC